LRKSRKKKNQITKKVNTILAQNFKDIKFVDFFISCLIFLFLI